jgi:malate dehydrogenase (oxaloacetate-decarboxylating)(NADP+)
VTAEMVQSMAAKPILFAMANPDPEITPAAVHAARDDALMATGRSDYPNQVNNVLGFPYIFKGTFDARAKAITQPMMIAAAQALAALAREPVPAEVLAAYKLDKLEFGRDYILPKPFDHRLIERIPPAVAAAYRAE